jgi:DNA polymerase
MTSTIKKNNWLEILIDQKEIFGDYLFIQKDEILNKTKDSNLIHEKTIKYKSDYSELDIFNSEELQWVDSKTLEELYSRIKDCSKCILHKNRTNFVFGYGNSNADVMIIGEGPGAEEDKQGIPFVGKAGMLLTNILKAINFSRDEVYIANIVKCRPPDNRTPFQEEMDSCFPFLEKQIELIKPKLILCLGLTAARGLLKKKESLAAFRGKVFLYNNSIKVMVTFHPAALLRNPNWKKDCWQDVQEFRKLYDETINNQ